MTRGLLKRPTSVKRDLLCEQRPIYVKRDLFM